jgi:hypothetical protein
MLEIFTSSFCLVFLRAMQQQHVIGGHYLAAAVTPFAIAAAEVASVLYVVKLGWPAVPFVGAGGAVGVCLAMVVFRRLKRSENSKPILKVGAGKTAKEAA